MIPLLLLCFFSHTFFIVFRLTPFSKGEVQERNEPKLVFLQAITLPLYFHYCFLLVYS